MVESIFFKETTNNSWSNWFTARDENLGEFFNNFPELHGGVNYNLIVDLLPIQYK